MTASQPQHLPRPSIPSLPERYAQVRATTRSLVEPLSEADCQAQSMADASPTKWHLAHVTWFFETFVLERFEPAFKPHHPGFRTLFNSYYHAVGDQHVRAQRGLITRPGLVEVMAYRAAVDARVLELLRMDPSSDLADLVCLGLQHEQQHQELILTDLLHLLSCNPLAPVYRAAAPRAVAAPVALAWMPHAGGLIDIGHHGEGFAFDNETPRHRQWLQPYALANRLVTQGEWRAFIDDGGYRQPRWWLSAGWEWVCSQRVQAPMHWRAGADGSWQVYTLCGLQAVDDPAPVAHVSLFEADAFAQWSAAQQGRPLRLPTEAEWEHAAQALGVRAIETGNLADSGALRPLPVAEPGQGLMQMYGDVWEWSRSAYAPYPGFKPWAGAVGEYNAKFMANQFVLRGGSCATPRSHIRASYRNFFPADARWQFTGLRLACDLA